MHVPPTCDLSDELCDSEMLGAGGPSGFLGQSFGLVLEHLVRLTSLV